jgi:RNA polymerase sigma-70 factor (ECF subfamily)
MDEGSNDFELILRRAENGDHDALGLAFERFRDGLKKAVRMRLDPRLGKRVDPSDVVQEVYLDASRRLP